MTTLQIANEVQDATFAEIGTFIATERLSNPAWYEGGPIRLQRGDVTCIPDDDSDAALVLLQTVGHMIDCASGIHSWSDAVGKLPPDTPCEHCGELYGNPA